MFHDHTNKLAAIAIGLGLILTPAISFADEKTLPPETSKIETQANYPVLKDASFQDMRKDADQKIFEARVWIKNHKAPQNLKNIVKDMEQATDRLQSKVAPAGRSIKSFASQNMPGKGIAQRGDRTYTVFGIILMMAFGFVFIVMNLSNPESRTGGRH